MTSGTSRRNLLQTTALAGALALSIAGTAVAQERVYNIPSQPLANSLRDYGIASGEQIIFAEGIVQGRQAPALQGAYESGQALAMLLAGTDLIAERTATGGVMIRKATQDPQGGRAASGASTVEALIVTAQKREEDIQDVPIAISAFSQEDLTRSQVAGGPDLMTQVPNMTFTKTNFSSYSIQIRGIGTQAISATTDPAVAVAFNNTPFIRNRFFEQEFYDLQRVEVLRGPQGTLYGRNATAGVVNIISAKPSFNYQAKVAADIANYSSHRLEGMLNIPLVEDYVALRIAGAWTRRDGYVWNEISGKPIDGRDLWSTRVSLRVTPNDRLDVNLIWEHFEENDDRLRSGKQLCHQDDRTEIAGLPIQGINTAQSGQVTWFSQGCLPNSLYAPDSFEAPDGYSLPYYLPMRAIGLPIPTDFDPYLSKTQSRDLRVIESTIEPEYWAKSDIVQLQLDFDVTDRLTLTSETAYNYDELFSLQDFNRFNTRPGAFEQPDEQVPGFFREGVLQEGPVGGIWCDPQLGCSDRLMGADLSTARSRQFSQELRLGSDFEGPFNFSLGANFLRYDTEDKYYVFVNTLSLHSANAAYGALGSVPYTPDYDGLECMVGYPRPDPLVAHSLGGFTACFSMDPNPIGSLNDEGHNYFLSKNPYKLISYAVFGEAYYEITEALKVTAGLRWTVDKKEAPRIPSAVLIPYTIGLTIQEVEEQEWREPTGRLTIDWKPELSFTDETLLYASYAHGYKAGGSNPPVSIKLFWGSPEGTEAVEEIIAQSQTKPKTFDAEFVDAFELGAKNTMFDGRITLNLAAFYYDYKDYQISQIIDRSARNFNFDAKVWGLELEADWRPLENLKFGLKLGYENTRVADGERAIDIMDRTAGNPDWLVLRPFPTFTENCILPVYVMATFGNVISPIGANSGSMGACEFAYAFGQDPRTRQPYVPNPLPGVTIPSGEVYPGFDPFDESQGHNFGEGFFKELGGNELPNAPDYTATLTADYTIPLAGDWLATLHTDLYYQSEAWTRIFNMEGYDKLKAYTNVNLAAIFTNEEAGWNVMAYVKNVFDRDSITGAFLFSDDVGLTTNVFLTEPRLYGLRVTKNWSGGPWWTGANPNHVGPYPLAVELGGALLRNDAPYDPVETAGDFQGNLDPALAQNRDLDIGEAKEVRLSWRPNGGAWTISGGARFGEAKTIDRFEDSQAVYGCFSGEPPPCSDGDKYVEVSNWVNGSVTNREEHLIADFTVGREVGIGGLKGKLGGGLGYGRFESKTQLDLRGVPDWAIPEDPSSDPAPRHRYYTDLTSNREFEGVGPQFSAELSQMLWEGDAGHLDLDVSLTGGVLFGKQKTFVEGEELSGFRDDPIWKYPDAVPAIGLSGGNRLPESTEVIPGPAARSSSATVPIFGVGLGLSYEVQRFKVSTGYRWERYFDVLDVGYAEERDGDRTLDGPYFKLSVGFGGG